MLGSPVATCRLAGSEISLLVIEKKLKGSPGKGRTQYNLADGVTALAQLYALCSHRVRSFNQWQRALFPNFIIIFHRARALRHTSALLRYNGRSLRNRYERAQFTAILRTSLVLENSQVLI